MVEYYNSDEKISMSYWQCTKSQIFPTRTFSYSILDPISILSMLCCTQWGLQVSNGPLSTRQATNIKNEGYLICWGNGWVTAKQLSYGFLHSSIEMHGCHFISLSIFSLISQQAHHCLPVGVKYGLSVVISHNRYSIIHPWEWTMLQWPVYSFHKMPVMQNHDVMMRCQNTPISLSVMSILSWFIINMTCDTGEWLKILGADWHKLAIWVPGSGFTLVMSMYAFIEPFKYSIKCLKSWHP